jgi:alpha-beta hydrolase superfamily lysophospholipase
MGLFFDDPMYERQATATLGYAFYGGSEPGECLATVQRIEEGDAESWHREFNVTADRLFALAEKSAAAGHRVSAREAYLRACIYYHASYVFLFGTPVDRRLIEAFDREVEAFLKAATLFESPVEPVEIPYEGTTLPGYFYRVDDSDLPRPTVIATNGYDSTIQAMHFGHAAAAVRRGYNCLLFDGPGQGRVLYKQGIPMRPDWENVVTPVVDYALSNRPEIDPEHIALIGWSFGGYLAPRAASGEHRLAACIADPGQWDLLEAVKGFLASLSEKSLDDLPDIDPSLLKPIEEHIMADASLRWSVVQRAYWVHGIDSLADYVRVAKDYELSSVADRISCPTLVTRAENDPVGAFAGNLYDALKSPKEMLHFTEAEGAGDHCEQMARSLFHQKSFDWLDETLGTNAT